MAYPDIDNQTPFAFAPVFQFDEKGQPLLATVVKATYRIGSDGTLVVSPDQVDVNLAGEYWGDPEVSSFRYEPESAPVKVGTDIVLIGHAHAPHASATRMDVALKVGALEKGIKVTGDRYWVKRRGVQVPTDPLAFEKILLNFEHAFGGWDCSAGDEKRHGFEARNPVGLGFRTKWGLFEERVRLPNLEYPHDRIKGWRDRPAPAAFGFTSPNWEPRVGYAGTYDTTWQKTKMPLLPEDFDIRYYNGAPADQIASGALRGDEPVIAIGMSPSGRIAFDLPGLPPPLCTIALRGQKDRQLQARLDTVIINADEQRLFLLWRANAAIGRGPEDVLAIKIESTAK